MSERVSSIPARLSALPAPLSAVASLSLLLLAAAPAAAQVGEGEWSPAVEAGVALDASRDAAIQASGTLTAHLLPGPAWTLAAGLRAGGDGAITGVGSLGLTATFDMLTWVPYAGLTAGLRWDGEAVPTAGIVLGLERRAERERASGLLLRLETPMHAPADGWSGALLFTYRSIYDTLATPDL